jgi:conjugal transfer pilus assembly protein TrbC
MKNYLSLGLIGFILSAPIGKAETMQSGIRAQWATYIVVSTTMPREQIVSLAHEASLANAVMVLNGFTGKNNNFQDVQILIGEINAACCDKQRPSRWVIDPRIIQRYRIDAAPSFVIGRGESPRNEDFSLVTGDLDLANALKTFAQQSRISAVRQYATATYQRAFETR